IRSGSSGIFVVAQHLLGDDLPLAVAQEPCVGGVVARFEHLAEDDFGFVEIVAEDGGIRKDAALRSDDLDGAGIASGERNNIFDERFLVHAATFLVKEEAIVRKVFLPRRRVSASDGIEEFLRATDELIVGDSWRSRSRRASD